MEVKLYNPTVAEKCCMNLKENPQICKLKKYILEKKRLEKETREMHSKRNQTCSRKKPPPLCECGMLWFCRMFWKNEHGLGNYISPTPNVSKNARGQDPRGMGGGKANGN